MKTFTSARFLGSVAVLVLAANLQGQLIKQVNFSKAEGYSDGALFGQPVGNSEVWTCVSANKGDSTTIDGTIPLIVHTVTNETLRIHPDHTGTELGVIYWALPFPVQKKGPITVTWDWQFFPTNEIPADYDPTNNAYTSQLQGTDCGFTLSDSKNRMLDGDPYAVFNELGTPDRMGDRCDTRNGTGDCDGGGTWMNLGPEYRDGKKLHMKVVAYFGDDNDPQNNTFDAWAQREGEEEWQTADRNYFRRCPTAENGMDCITMWLNNGDRDTYIVVDNIRVVGPKGYTEPPSVGLERSATGIKVTYTGTLQSADSPQGPYTDLAGSSPRELPASGAAKFYRARN